jgi:hypothetical protein
LPPFSGLQHEAFNRERQWNRHRPRAGGSQLRAHTEAATTEAGIERLMGIPVDAERIIRARQNMPSPRERSNGLRGAAITFGGS